MLTSNTDDETLIAYWKNNHHLFVCNLKVGSTVIRHNCRHNYESLGILCKVQNRILFEKELDNYERQSFFLVRSPFYRVISSYKYRLHKRFETAKSKYLLEQNINIDSLNIIEYIRLMEQEIKLKKYNGLVKHFMPQLLHWEMSSAANSTLGLLWETEKIEKLLEIWNQAFNVRLDTKQRKNVTTLDQNLYIKYYLEYPMLYGVICSVFKEDLKWLNPFFNYSNKFKQLLDDDLAKSLHTCASLVYGRRQESCASKV